jgi:hypothetical protein
MALQTASVNMVTVKIKADEKTEMEITKNKIHKLAYRFSIDF